MKKPGLRIGTLVAALACLQVTFAANAPMIDFATPGSVSLNGDATLISLSGTSLGSCRVIRLSHFEHGLTANVTDLTSSASSVIFSFAESWSAGSVQVQAVSDENKISNLAVLTLYNPPSITSITPNRASVAGGSVLALSGDGLFASAALQVSITTDEISQTVAGAFMDDDGTVQITMPQFPLPPGVNLGMLGPGEEIIMDATVRISMNGVDFEETTTLSLSIFAGAVFQIGYLYSGPVTDFGWVYNWNTARMEVDSRHPQVVQSEYVENIAEEMYSSTPFPEQEAALVIRGYCERNFDLVRADATHALCMYVLRIRCALRGIVACVVAMSCVRCSSLCICMCRGHDARRAASSRLCGNVLRTLFEDTWLLHLLTSHRHPCTGNHSPRHRS